MTSWWPSRRNSRTGRHPLCRCVGWPRFWSSTDARALSFHGWREGEVEVEDCGGQHGSCGGVRAGDTEVLSANERTKRSCVIFRRSPARSSRLTLQTHHLGHHTPPRTSQRPPRHRAHTRTHSPSHSGARNTGGLPTFQPPLLSRMRLAPLPLHPPPSPSSSPVKEGVRPLPTAPRSVPSSPAPLSLSARARVAASDEGLRRLLASAPPPHRTPSSGVCKRTPSGGPGVSKSRGSRHPRGHEQRARWFWRWCPPLTGARWACRRTTTWGSRYVWFCCGWGWRKRVEEANAGLSPHPPKTKHSVPTPLPARP